MDLTKYILRTKLDNTDDTNKAYASKNFQTEDLIYLNSYHELEDTFASGRITYPTDYAVMNNGLISREYSGPFNRKSCEILLRSAYSINRVDSICCDGGFNSELVSRNKSSFCPALRLSLLSVIYVRNLPFSFDEFKIEVVKDMKGDELYHTIKFGEFPKTYVGDELNSLLHNEYDDGAVQATGKKYTGYRNDYGQIIYNPEYVYKGQKYVRVSTKRYNRDSEYSDRTEAPESGTYMWVKVEPITWKIRNWDELPKEINPKGRGTAKYIDVRTEDAIMAGLPFYPYDKEDNCSMWQNSAIRGYLNGINVNYIQTNGNKKFTAPDSGYWTKQNFLTEALNIEMQNIESNSLVEEVENQLITPVKKSRLEKLNPDTTPISTRRRMTDSEIIKSWIDAGQSVLLRGPSGIGKTERIKKLYPNHIYIKLTNNMFPEKVVGSMNLQTGEAIPPDFAKTALLECATDEEKKLINENIQNLYKYADEIYERSKNSKEKIVILLDELLNVRPAVQSLVYTLVLNKIVEIGKGLKLPANVVIVATGNQKKYSNVAGDLAEPLEKRFDHILDMEPKVGEWLYEYAIPNKIHPSVIGYVFSKYQQCRRSESIKNIGYFYEEPEVGEKQLDKNGCRGRTNDPRGWVSISNTLYAFEEDLKNGKFVGKDVESLLKVTIGSKLREEWAEEFFDFYNHPTLTVEDVIQKKYTKFDLPNDTNERFGQMASLLNANMKQVEEVRKFIRVHCDPEYLAVYDIYWAGNDEERMEKIAELRELSQEETFDGINKKINENKHNFKLTLEEFWDKNEERAIYVRNKEEELLIRKAFDKAGKKWISGHSYLSDHSDSYSDKLLFFTNDGRYSYNRVSWDNLKAGVKFYIEDVDLIPYLNGKDLTRFNEICEEYSKTNDIEQLPF